MDVSFLPRRHELLVASIAVGGLGCLIFAAVLWVRSQRSGRLRPPMPPGSLGLPWVGESLQFLSALGAGEPDRFLEHRFAKFKSEIFKTRVLGQRMVMVRGSSANRFLVAKENNQLLRNSWPSATLQIVGAHAPNGKHGAEHRRLRHLMASCLSPLALQKLVGIVDGMTQHHFDTQWHGLHHLTLFPLLKTHTFRVACSLLADVQDDALLAHLHPYFNAWVAGIIEVPIDLPGTSYRKAKDARKVLLEEVGKLIDRRHEKLKEAKLYWEPEDLLSTLLMAQDENGSSLTREEVLDVILFLLFAGHDTTTSAVTFSMRCLAENPACYDRVVREQEEIASQKKPGDKLTWADVQNMKYTWKVVQETLRVRPIVQGGLKEATQDLDFKGYLIPKGWKVFFSICNTHHDAQYFSDPRKFDPSRFDEGKEGPPPYTYVPFGIGPHSCPGGEFAKMTVSVYLHHLVRRFKWSLMAPNEGVRILPNAFPLQGFPITIFEKLGGGASSSSP